MAILIRVSYVHVFVQLSFVQAFVQAMGTDEPPIGVQWAGTYNIVIAKQEYK